MTSIHHNWQFVFSRMSHAINHIANHYTNYGGCCVVAGLVESPVIAVPTSIGYGASFGGLAALLGRLNSCATGLTVVNIDNGFGAAVAAGAIVRMVHEAARADVAATQRTQ